MDLQLKISSIMCPRCLKYHAIGWQHFNSPGCYDHEFWGMCVETGDPVLLGSRDAFRKDLLKRELPIIGNIMGNTL